MFTRKGSRDFLIFLGLRSERAKLDYDEGQRLSGGTAMTSRSIVKLVNLDLSRVDFANRPGPAPRDRSAP